MHELRLGAESAVVVEFKRVYPNNIHINCGF